MGQHYLNLTQRECNLNIESHNLVPTFIVYTLRSVFTKHLRLDLTLDLVQIEFNPTKQIFSFLFP